MRKHGGLGVSKGITGTINWVVRYQMDATPNGGYVNRPPHRLRANHGICAI